jgi:hypothetical protein
MVTLLRCVLQLSADDDDKNDPATVASLNAAQHAATAVSDARALRVSQINADLPPAQFLTLTVLAMLLLGSFLLTDLKNDKAQHQSIEPPGGRLARALATTAACYMRARPNSDVRPL